MDKHSQGKLGAPKALTGLDATGSEPLFDLVKRRLSLSDSMKIQLRALTYGEQLFLAQTMVAPPSSAADREFYGQLFWANIRGRFEQTLSADDLRLWKTPPADVGSSPAHVRLLKSFDTFLLAQFRHWGPALFMSHGVLQRIFGWRRNDPHRLKLLADELELNSKAIRGEAGVRFSIGPDLGAFKREVVVELRLLFSKIRTEFSTRNRTPALIADWVERVVKQQPRVFSSLRRNLPPLKSFLLIAPEDLVLGIVTRRTHAQSFVDTWVASATGYSVQRARQVMSSSPRK